MPSMEAEQSVGPAAVAEHGRIVLPGDQVVQPAALANASVISVGTGLVEVSSGLVAARSGTVKVLPGKSGAGDVRVWIDGNSRRYTPSAQVLSRENGGGWLARAKRGSLRDRRVLLRAT